MLSRVLNFFLAVVMRSDGSATDGYFSLKSQASRRIKRLYSIYWFWLLGFGTVGIVLTVSVLFQTMLLNESRSVANSELDQLAHSSILRLERRLNETVSVLRGLAKAGRVECGGSNMLAYAEAAKGQAAVTRISLVGPSGYVLCSTAPIRNDRVKLLPEHFDLHPRVSLVQPDARAPELMVVSWHTTDGIRLAAVVDGRRLEMDAHPILFAGLLYRQIKLNKTVAWISDGVPLLAGEAENVLSAKAEGRRFPIEATVTVPDSILGSLNLAPKLTVPFVALILLFVVSSSVW